VDHDDVGDFELAGLFPHIRFVAGLWLHGTMTTSATSRMAVSPCPAPTVSTMTVSNPAAEQPDPRSTFGAPNDAWAWPLRMTPHRRGRFGMRMRSPSKPRR
jgi:hypothetical protein